MKNRFPSYNKKISPPQDAKNAAAINPFESFGLFNDGANAADKYNSNKGINTILVILGAIVVLIGAGSAVQIRRKKK